MMQKRQPARIKKDRIASFGSGIVVINIPPIFSIDSIGGYFLKPESG